MYPKFKVLTTPKSELPERFDGEMKNRVEDVNNEKENVIGLIDSNYLESNSLYTYLYY